jgi:hypothetical protein
VPEEAIFEKIEVKDQHFVVDGLMEVGISSSRLLFLHPLLHCFFLGKKN